MRVLCCILGLVGATFAQETQLDNERSPPVRRQVAMATSVPPRIVTTTVSAPAVTQAVVTRTQTIIASGASSSVPTASSPTRPPISTDSNTTVPAGYTVPRAFE